MWLPEEARALTSEVAVLFITFCVVGKFGPLPSPGEMASSPFLPMDSGNSTLHFLPHRNKQWEREKLYVLPYTMSNSAVKKQQQ